MNPKYIPQFFISFFLILMVFGSTANATNIINLDYSFILDTDGSNPYGLIDGDIATVNITLDTDQGYLDGVYSTHTRNDTDLSNGDTSDDQFFMSLVFGNMTYTEVADVWWDTWPAVTIVNADESIHAIDTHIIDDDAMFKSEIFIELDGGGNLVLAAEDSTAQQLWSITGNPVPEPGTFILLGFGLFSLAGLHRKRSLK